MIKILVVQFRKNPDFMIGERTCFCRVLTNVSEVCFLDGLDFSIDWSDASEILRGFQGVVLGGSGDLDFDGGRNKDDEVRLLSQKLLKNMSPFFQYLLDNDVPTLGICFGHQLFGAWSGVKVCCDEKQRKTCSSEVKLMVNKDEEKILTNLPERFFAHYGHKDVLESVPENAKLIISGGEVCKVSALRYKNNIYTVQFHPELNHFEIQERIKSLKGYLPEGVEAEVVFKPDNNSNLIIHNFLNLIRTKLV